ncbi:NTP/NDP exchange transporter [Candidatus Dependentiae bacterium]
MVDSIKQFFIKIAQTIWGKFDSKAELRKFLSLAAIFFFVILVYWTLRPIKDSVFFVTVGAHNLPWAKIFSALFVLPVVMFYMKIVEKFQREKVFYTMMGIYAVTALAFTFAFMSPTIGLANTTVSSSRWIGWLWYWFIESYGSVIIASFWVIVTDITLPDSAKRGFPLIYIFGQLGNIVGPYFITAKNLGFTNSAPIPAICAAIMILIAVMLWLFMKYTPKDQLKRYEGKQEGKQVEGAKTKKKKVGFVEGIKTIFSNGYLMGILFIVMVFEVIVTIFDYQFKLMARTAFPLEIDSSAYLAQYAYTTGIVAFLCVLFGINSIQRKLGIFVSLLVTPLLVLSAVFLLWSYPILNVAFWIMVFSKAVNYALNQPTLKNMYIPVKKETRYKTMGWIEAFGGRSSKSIGSAINLLRKLYTSKYGVVGAALFLNVSSSISIALVGIWFLVAFYLSTKHKKAIANDEYVC